MSSKKKTTNLDSTLTGIKRAFDDWNKAPEKTEVQTQSKIINKANNNLCPNLITDLKKKIEALSV